MHRILEVSVDDNGRTLTTLKETNHFQKNAYSQEYMYIIKKSLPDYTLELFICCEKNSLTVRGINTLLVMPGLITLPGLISEDHAQKD